MRFSQIVGTCLNFSKKSLQLEIDNYIELTDPSIKKPITKQAFSKARQNISPNAFKYLFLMTAETALESGNIKGTEKSPFFRIGDFLIHIYTTKHVAKNKKYFRTNLK